MNLLCTKIIYFQDELQSPLQGYIEVKNGMLNGKISIIDVTQKLETTMKENNIQL